MPFSRRCTVRCLSFLNHTLNQQEKISNYILGLFTKSYFPVAFLFYSKWFYTKWLAMIVKLPKPRQTETKVFKLNPSSF